METYRLITQCPLKDRSIQSFFFRRKKSVLSNCLKKKKKRVSGYVKIPHDGIHSSFSVQQTKTIRWTWCHNTADCTYAFIGIQWNNGYNSESLQLGHTEINTTTTMSTGTNNMRWIFCLSESQAMVAFFKQFSFLVCWQRDELARNIFNYFFCHLTNLIIIKGN